MTSIRWREAAGQHLSTVNASVERNGRIKRAGTCEAVRSYCAGRTWN